MSNMATLRTGMLRRSRATTGGDRPVFVVHSLAQAEAVLRAAAGTGVVVSSAPAAAGQAGTGWFLAILEALAERPGPADWEGLLDCGDDAAAAIEALHAGARWIRLDGPDGALREVAGAARTLGARVNGPTGPVLDLGRVDDAGEACREFLARFRR